MATKEEILDYATNTPENTNRNVLNSMLENYGGGSSEGPLLVNVVYEDPSTQTKGPLRTSVDFDGQWLDTNSATIFNALLSRGVIVHQYFPADDENPALDSYVPISSWYKVESESLFGFSVDGSSYEGSDTGYPAKVGV